MVRRIDDRGMTLIEVLVALLIVSGLLLMVVPAVTARAGVRVKEEAGQLAGAIRYLYDYAALHGQTCRIVFTLQPGEGGIDRYRFECTEGSPKLTASPMEVRDGHVEIEDDSDDAFDAAHATEEEKFQRQITAGPVWNEFSSPVAEPQELPPDVSIRGFWTPRLSDVVTEGDAWLYFFPMGETQRALVWLTDGYDNVYTLSVQPLTGRVRVHAEDLEVPRD